MTLPFSNFARVLFVAVSLAIPVSAAWAAGISWQSLSPAEQRVLQQHRGSWNSYSPQQQQRLRNGAQKYLQLNKQQQQDVRRKQQEYDKLSPQEKQRLREEYRRSHR